jgi:hypothetical protein
MRAHLTFQLGKIELTAMIGIALRGTDHYHEVQRRGFVKNAEVPLKNCSNWLTAWPYCKEFWSTRLTEGQL